MTREEFLALMEKLSGEVSGLESKRAKAEKEEEVKVLDGLIAEKQGEYDKAKKEVEALDAKSARENELKELKGDGKVDSKKDDLAAGAPKEVQAKVIPDSQSEHNRLVNQKKLDDAMGDYMTSPVQGGLDVLGKWSGEMCDALQHSDPAAKGGGGFKAPSYMSRYILGRIESKTPNAVAAAIGAKGSDNVLQADASGTLSGGGSLVPDTFITELFRFPQITTRLIDRCMVKRSVTGVAQFPRLAQATNRYGVVAAWGTEGSAPTKDNPVFNRKDVSTHKLALFSQLSKRELRQNRVGLLAELSWMFRGAMDEQISKAILSGTGSGQPQGINHVTAIAAGVNVVARETIDEVSYTDLVGLQFAIEDAIFEDGLFIFRSGSNGALKFVSALDDSDGRPVLRNHNIGWREGVGAVRTIAGSEFLATPDNVATLGNRGDVIYGAFGGYGVAVDLDVTIERSDHFAFTSGMATFLVTAYIGGYPIGENMFALLGDVSTASSSSSSST